MQNDLIPQALHRPYTQFLLYLEQLATQLPSQCPYCASPHFKQTRVEPLTLRCKRCLKYFNPLTITPFNRLSPAHWLAVIFVGRTQRDTYLALAEQLDCSVKKVIRRDRAVMQVMQTDWPALYAWYHRHNEVNQGLSPNALPELLVMQQLTLKQKVTEYLTATQAICLYCQSANTVKIGQRTAFLCRACRRSFNLLQGTPISRLRDANKWLPFVDLLVAKQSNVAIAAQLGLNNITIGHWRRKWCFTMRQWGLSSLATWCKR